MLPMQEPLAVRSLMSGPFVDVKAAGRRVRVRCGGELSGLLKWLRRGELKRLLQWICPLLPWFFALASGGEEAADLPGVSHQGSVS